MPSLSSERGGGSGGTAAFRVLRGALAAATASTMATLLWSVPAAGGVRAGAAPTLDARASDRIMVRLAADAEPCDFISAFETAHAGFGVILRVVDAIDSRRTFLLQLDGPPLRGWVLDQLERDLQTNVVYRDLVAWCEFVYEGQVAEGRTGSFWFYLTGGTPHPPDPAAPTDEDLFRAQYASQKLGLEAAHQRSTGAGTTVAVLDTGVDASHPLLRDRIVSNGYNFVGANDDTSDIGDGRDTDADGLLDEMTGHGTFVAGLIALAAPDAGILPVRVLDGDGVGDNWLIAKGIYHAIDQGVDVINLSLGSTYGSAAVRDAVEEAHRAGIVSVAAAGNLDRHEPGEFPAMLAAVIGVAATDDRDAKALFSNFNHALAISAPGVSARGAGPDASFDVKRSIISALPGGRYGTWEGTSMSTALVSAAAAIVAAQHACSLDVAREDLAERIATVLSETAVTIDAVNPQYEGRLGAGRLDVAAATAAGPEPPVPGDLDHDGQVGVTDLIVLLNSWGSSPSSPCGADLDGDGTVGPLDLDTLLAAWTD